VIFYAVNVIYATGGPAGLYARSVYPESQAGASGIAFEAGVAGKNLTEWQYGIASIKFRWNLSGTYQQVLPAYISTDSSGENPREFLGEYFDSPERLLNAVFLKGYQWPFDPRKLENYGSSLIDAAVYHETQNKNRRVFLDFRKNPAALDFAHLGASETSKECHDYLRNSGALFGTPVERLNRMNPAAIALYQSNGIDLRSEPLEIAVCAQHNNGGLSGDMWWESNIRGFFPVGEVNGTHGVYRPGGSALNSGQCGGMRAATLIARERGGSPDINLADADSADFGIAGFIAQISAANIGESSDSSSNVAETRREIGEIMTGCAAHIRNAEAIKSGAEWAREKLRGYWGKLKLRNIGELPAALSNRDLLIAQHVYLAAMLDYIRRGGASRGSYMVEAGAGAGREIHAKLPFRYIPPSCDGYDGGGESDDLSGMVQEAALVGGIDGEAEITWRERRPVPDAPRWFETVWGEYQKYQKYQK